MGDYKGASAHCALRSICRQKVNSVYLLFLSYTPFNNKVTKNRWLFVTLQSDAMFCCHLCYKKASSEFCLRRFVSYIQVLPMLLSKFIYCKYDSNRDNSYQHGSYRVNFSKDDSNRDNSYKYGPLRENSSKDE